MNFKKIYRKTYFQIGEIKDNLEDRNYGLAQDSLFTLLQEMDQNIFLSDNDVNDLESKK